MSVGATREGGEPAGEGASPRRSSCSSSTARWRATAADIGARPNPWTQDEERIARVVAARRAELAQMQAYMRHTGCLMEFLVRLLDDPDPAPCGRCVNCTGTGLPRTSTTELVHAAVSFLRRDLRTIEPRMRGPADAIEGLSGPIDAAEPARDGAVRVRRCGLGAGGPARQVRRRRRSVPSWSRPRRARSETGGARRPRRPGSPPCRRPLGAGSSTRSLVPWPTSLGLPYVETLSVLHGAAPQKAMQNSAQQLRNALPQARRSMGPAVRPGPVLLVDDIVDSRWTLTVAGWLLRTHGSGEVHPFALAVASARDD